MEKVKHLAGEIERYLFFPALRLLTEDDWVRERATIKYDDGETN